MSRNSLRVSDIEHFHWSLAESDVPKSVELEKKPLSVPAAVELAIIQASAGCAKRTGSFFNSSGICATSSVIRATRWPAVDKAHAQKSGDTMALVLPSNSSEENGWWTKQLQLLKDELVRNHFSPRLAAALTGGVGEMVDNAWLHSFTQTAPLLVYQVRPRKFAFSVADLGIGVLESLRKNPRFDFLRSSMEAIAQAIEPGVSRVADGGMGFATMLASMAELWGNARIRSGEAAMIIDRTHETLLKNFIYLPQLPGLHVSARCSLDSPDNQTP
jgi:hypothetical protein